MSVFTVAITVLLSTTMDGMQRTAAARAARRRQKEERLARELRERGWTVIPPEGEKPKIDWAALRGQ